MKREATTRRMLLSEREAFARMGTARRLVHRVLAAIYWGVEPAYPYRDPFSRVWLGWWRLYRRTWPR